MHTTPLVGADESAECVAAWHLFGLSTGSVCSLTCIQEQHIHMHCGTVAAPTVQRHYMSITLSRQEPQTGLQHSVVLQQAFVSQGPNPARLLFMESAVTQLLRAAALQAKYARADDCRQSQQGRHSHVQAHLDHLLYIMGDVLE